MTIEEAKKFLIGISYDLGNISVEYLSEKHGEKMREAIKVLEGSCDDEYIKVPKKALKYRTAGMVAYNIEWLKNHFDIERDVICGVKKALEQQPFINKPCVAHQVCHEDKVKTLDKIRDEIMDVGAYEQEVKGKTEFLKGINYCLEIIDKYKTESDIKQGLNYTDEDTLMPAT